MEPAQPEEIDRLLFQLGALIDETQNETAREILENACWQLRDLCPILDVWKHSERANDAA